MPLNPTQINKIVNIIKYIIEEDPYTNDVPPGWEYVLSNGTSLTKGNSPSFHRWLVDDLKSGQAIVNKVNGISGKIETANSITERVYLYFYKK